MDISFGDHTVVESKDLTHKKAAEEALENTVKELESCLSDIVSL